MLRSGLLAPFVMANAQQLKGLNINPNTVTVAGFSSGSQMSHQLHVVNSAKIKSAGLGNGGVYASANAGVACCGPPMPENQL